MHIRNHYKNVYKSLLLLQTNHQKRYENCSRLTPDNNMVNANEVNNVINNTREKIKMLYERLEKAKAI